MDQNNQVKEIFEITEDTVDNFDQLNEKYRKNLDWIKDEQFINQEELITDSIDPKTAFRRLYNPTKKNDETLTYDVEYRQLDSDPLERISNLKNEIIEVKKLIDDYAEQFSCNEFVKESDNLPQVFRDLEIYKSKIDAFVNYDLFSDQGGNESDKSENLSEKSVKIKEFNSLFEKYHRITENLISQVKLNEQELLNQEKGTNNVQYEIYANPENEIEILSTKLSEIEEMINNLEKSIGNWDIYNNNESISTCLTKLLNFSVTKLNERYDKKFQTIKEFGNLISSFMDKRKDKIVTGSYYLKIKELYSILEIYEHFDQIFDYIKKRIKAIKEIFDTSDQFNVLLENLKNQITKNEENLLKLYNKYSETLATFSEFEVILKEIDILDNEFKKLLI